MERKNKMPIKVGGVIVDVTKINEKKIEQQVQPEPQQVVLQPEPIVVEVDPVDLTPPARKIVKQKPRPKITETPTPLVAPTQVPLVSPTIVIVFCSQVFAVEIV